MTNLSSVDRLQHAYEETKVEAKTYIDLNSQLLTDMAAVRQAAHVEVAALKTQIVSLQEENRTLRTSLTNLNATHNSLLAHSLLQTEQIDDLRSCLLDKQPLLLLFLRTLFLTLPTDSADDDIPDDSFYYFLCADPAADQNAMSSNPNTLLRYLHPDKSPNPDDSTVEAAAHLVPLIMNIKRVLTQTSLRLVYDHCVVVSLVFNDR